MKRALILNLIDPRIGGVLVRGDKGTAKSTTVRSLVQVTPDVEAAAGCRFGCDPRDPRRICEECRARLAAGGLEAVRRRMDVVELPLNVTEDRLCGSLDVEHILRTGERRFQSGILARANGNILYVDEVNLLDDHIVDLLLDSAAMGVNHVEREGVSFSHPSRFVLVGSMNPEEGSLRPQFLDRFGMCVDVTSDRDPDIRTEVIKRRLAFDSDPESYTESAAEETEELRRRVADSREMVADVEVDDRLIHKVSVVSIKFGMEGHRADIAMIRAARANAAFEGRDSATDEDVLATAGFVLGHRIRKGPFEEAVFRKEDLRRCLSGY